MAQFAPSVVPPPAPKKSLIQELLSELGIGPKAEPTSQASPPLVKPQTQNPLQAPGQTGVPSVAATIPPPQPKQAPKLAGFPDPVLGSANPLSQVLPASQNPGTSASGMVPKAVASQYANNKKKQVKRDLGAKLLRQATAPTPPSNIPTPPPPPQEQAPTLAKTDYRQPAQGLQYLAAALSILFPGVIGRAAGSFSQGMNTGAEQSYERRQQQASDAYSSAKDQYDRNLAQRQQQIIDAQQGYDFQTGQPLPAPPIFTAKQNYISPKATPQELEQHYLHRADIAEQYAVSHPGPEGEAAAKSAIMYKELADTAAQGYERFAQGDYTKGARTQEALAHAKEYAGANATKLAALSQEERSKAILEGKRLANQVHIANLNITSRNAIALRAALYHLHGMEEGLAMRQAIAEYQQGQMNYRAGDADTAPGFDNGGAGSTININLGQGADVGSPSAPNSPGSSAHGAIVKTGTANGKHVTQYADGAVLFDDGTPVP